MKRCLLLVSVFLALWVPATSIAAATTRVACVGDSITAGSGTSGGEATYPAWLGVWLGPAYDVRNFGVSGATLLNHADKPYTQQRAHADALAFKPDIVVIKLGTNDSKHPTAPGGPETDNWRHKADFVADYTALIAGFRAANPAARIYVCLPVPAYPGRWGINDQTLREEIAPLVRQIAASTRATLIDLYAPLSGKPELFPDTVHPNDAGARLLAAAVFQGLTGAAPKPLPAPKIRTVAAVSPLAGKRVLWLGDSITQDGRYVTFVEYFLNRAYPQARFDVVSIGLGSETASGLSEKTHPFPRPAVHERLARALEKVKPQVVVACYGMNDGIYHPPSPERLQAFQAGITRLLAAARAAGARVILLTPPPFDAQPVRGKTRPAGSADFAYSAPYEGYDDALAEFARWELTQKAADVLPIDVHTPLSAALKQRRATQPTFAFAGDGIHPSAAGHLLMAQAVLRGLGVEVDLRGDLAQAAAELATDPLLGLVKQHREVRSRGWLEFVGYTRDKTVSAPTVDPTETQAAALQQKIDALRRQPAGASAR